MDYLPEHPRAADARLMVEVSDTAPRLDRGRKQRPYARGGVVEYWIINPPERQVEVHRDPTGGRYRSVVVFGEQEVITPLAAPHASVRVDELLPPLSANR